MRKISPANQARLERFQRLKMRAITFELKIDDITKLKIAAAHRNVTMSEIIRDLIQKYV